MVGAINVEGVLVEVVVLLGTRLVGQELLQSSELGLRGRLDAGVDGLVQPLIVSHSRRSRSGHRKEDRADLGGGQLLNRRQDVVSWVEDLVAKLLYF